MNRAWAVIAIAGAVALAGCAGGPKPATTVATGAKQASGASASTMGAASASAAAGQAITAAPAAGPKSSYENRVVYFDFNKSIVKPQFFPLLKTQAAYLLAHPAAHVILEGYTDDRGTWEYNIGLGARRAAAVEQYLLLQGVNQKQLNTISYGEAYPADPQDNEAAWAKNRRVVIKYQEGAQP